MSLQPLQNRLISSLFLSFCPVLFLCHLSINNAAVPRCGPCFPIPFIQTNLDHIGPQVWFWFKPTHVGIGYIAIADRTEVDKPRPQPTSWLFLHTILLEHEPSICIISITSGTTAVLNGWNNGTRKSKVAGTVCLTMPLDPWLEPASQSLACIKVTWRMN